MSQVRLALVTNKLYSPIFTKGVPNACTQLAKLILGNSESTQICLIINYSTGGYMVELVLY